MSTVDKELNNDPGSLPFLMLLNTWFTAIGSDVWTRTTRLIIAVGAICYTLGFFIHFTYRAELGLSVGSLIRGDFILCGLVFVGIPIFCIVILGCAIVLFLSLSKDKTVRSEFAFYRPVAIGGVVVFGFMLWQFGVTMEMAHWLGYTQFPALLFFTMGQGYKFMHRPGYLLIGTPCVVLGIAMSFWSILYFAESVFPQIPRTFGGAKPIEVEIRFVESEREAVWCGLIDESDDYLTVLEDRDDQETIVRYPTSKILKITLKRQLYSRIGVISPLKLPPKPSDHKKADPAATSSTTVEPL